ncbi:MAG: hypothetical protein IKG15_02365 [Solobacterium sp.]|nr:hypothetical protein [Solobacterium sp.]
MSKVFWNKKEIPTPNDSYIDKSDGRVYIRTRDSDGRSRRRTIGHAASETTMHPNELYKTMYPALWEMHYGDEELREHSLSMGMYALMLGIVWDTGLYPILQDVYGPRSANAILDYAMFSIMDRSNTTQLFTERMKTEVLFSSQAYSDAWYSRFFKEEMSENLNHQFRMQWLNHCKKKDITNCWLSIDGSNNDCEVKKSDLPEQGEAKSHTHSDIIGYMYAVNAKDGRPITYFTYEGSVPDCKSFHRIAFFLSGADIETDGVILDRGFCTDDVIHTCLQCGFPFIIMMHSNFKGHTSMAESYGETIRWNLDYAVTDEGLFGISEKTKLFLNSDTEAYVNLYFDGIRGSHQSVKLLAKIREEKRRLDHELSIGRNPEADSNMKKYITIQEEDGVKKAVYRYENWKKDMFAKGYFSIASYNDLGPEPTINIYHLRDASETQYGILKSQEGYDTTRVHSTPGIQNKFAVAFIAGIIRSEIQLACKELGLDTNEMIRKMDRIRLLLLSGEQYAYTKSHTVNQMKLLNHFGITEKHLEYFADEVNRRMNTTIVSQTHTLPSELEMPRERRKRGRQKGSKNKKTLQKEAELARRIANGEVIDKEEKRRAGRPKGRKDSTPRKRRTKAEIQSANTIVSVRDLKL